MSNSNDKRICWLIIIFILLLMGGASSGYALNAITFGPKETRINGSIKYSVLGKYLAHFESFTGTIKLDDQSHAIRSVDLAIKASTLRSNCAWCDKIVCSKRLLNTAIYPQIIFKSDTIIKDGKDYRVHGTLSMHGISKAMTFPFVANFVQEHGRNVLDLKGKWVINRKAFGITWNKLLDHGGVLVGDQITVDWGIRRIL